MSSLHRRVRGCLDPLLALALILCVAKASPRLAGAEAPRRPFAIAAGGAEATLETFSEQADVQIVYLLEDVRGVTTNAMRGDFAVSEALARLVAGTRLRVAWDEKTGAFVVRRERSAILPASVKPIGDTTTMKRKNPLALFGAWLALALGSGHAAGSPSGPTGAIEGRVFNPANGEYLENARLTIEGTGIETFTDASGHYRLPNVPAGSVTLKVFFTGLVAQSDVVTVTAGQTMQHDVTGAMPGEHGGIVKLSEFVVGASKEMSGSAIAINEQRIAPNIKNVVTTDEFGIVAEGNVAEFMKFLPGVTISYSGGEAVELSLNGVPANNVPVNVGGFSLAGVRSTTGRAAQIGEIALNNVSRIEVSFSPTPDTQGSALAGAVDMVPLSAFERSHPVFNYSTWLSARSNDTHFNKTPGPRAADTRKVHPGFTFSLVVPVNDHFGFTVAGGAAVQYTTEPLSQNTWRGSGTATNGTTFPDTTPDKPYLTAYTVRDGTTEVRRSSFSATFDYKISRTDQMSFSFQSSEYTRSWMLRNLTFTINQVLPGNFSLTSTHGAPGAGTLQMSNGGRDRYDPVYTPTLVWHHNGPIWKADAGAGFSRMDNKFAGTSNGLFMGTTATRSGVTIAFDNNSYLRPQQITVTDGATGAPIDPYKLSNYSLTAATDAPDHVYDVQRTAFANLRRDLDWRLPFTLKGGIDVRQGIRDTHIASRPYSFVGRDGRASTTPVGSDDGAASLVDASFSQRTAPYGFPQIQWVSNEQALALFNSNPGYFTSDANTLYRNMVTGSKRAEETISALYVRGDLQLFDRRLKLVGGVRGEQTNDKAWGPLTDPTRNFQRDAQGKPVLGTNGRPLTIATDPLAVSKLTFIERGARAEKEYLRLFPSLNASFNIRENLVARAAYYHSVGRPDFNQYAGGITLPDSTQGPSPTNQIVVNNAGIKAWSARSGNVRLEYYFSGVGQVSVGAFRREIENMFGNTVFIPTPAFLGEYGLDPAVYGAYNVSTQYNLPGVVRMEGLEFNYKQALTFLPSWARGLQLFANGNTLRAIGPNVDALTGANYIPRSANWGISLTRQKFDVRINWNYHGRQLMGPVAAGRGIAPGTKNWSSKRNYVDISGEYRLHKWVSLYAAIRNLNDVPEDMEIVNTQTPYLARLRQRQNFGALWTVGLKGSF